MIAIDFETYPITAEAPAPKPVCLSYYDRFNSACGVLTGQDMHDFLIKILTGTGKIIAHNLKFESAVIHEHFPDLRDALFKAYEDKRLECTMVREKLMENFLAKKPKKKFDLATLVKQYIKKDISAGKKNPDAWRLRYNELDGIPVKDWPQEAYDYALDDSIYAYKVYEHQEKALKDHNLSYRSTRADFVLTLTANRGMKVDTGRVSTLESDIINILKPHYGYLERKGFVYKCKKIKGKYRKNQKIFREYLERTIENPEYTAKGVLKIGSESLSKYICKDSEDSDLFNKIISSFETLTKYEKVLTSFVPQLKVAAEKGKMRTNYNPVVSTGRTSSSGSKLYPSCNIQQCPRELEGVTYDVRNCFKAREGRVLVSIDYGGLELCATAQALYAVYGKSTMMDMLNEGNYPSDLHSKLAARVMSSETGKEISYEFFLANKGKPEFKKYRQICKALNLGFPGGIGYLVMGGQLFKNGIIINKFVLKDEEGKTIKVHSEYYGIRYLAMLRRHNPNIRLERVGKKTWIFVYDELVGLKQEFFNTFPELETFLTDTHNLFKTGEFKYVKNEFDEYEKEELYKYNAFGTKRDFAMYTQFCNAFLMQATSAEGAKQMLWDIHKYYKSDPDVELMAFIHDEIVFEVKKGPRMEEIIDRTSEIMIDSMNKVLPNVRINVEADAMEYWSKDGDGTYGALYWKNTSGNGKFSPLQKEKKKKRK